jgi:hypothetical protein
MWQESAAGRSEKNAVIDARHDKNDKNENVRM